VPKFASEPDIGLEHSLTSVSATPVSESVVPSESDARRSMAGPVAWPTTLAAAWPVRVSEPLSIAPSVPISMTREPVAVAPAVMEDVSVTA
jgi:hypothetical protein